GGHEVPAAAGAFGLVRGRRPRRHQLFPYTTLFRSEHEREQQAGEQDEEQRDAVDTEVPRDPEVLDPEVLRGELEAGVVTVELGEDRKSKRLNSSHVAGSYAVFRVQENNRLEGEVQR